MLNNYHIIQCKTATPKALQSTLCATANVGRVTWHDKTESGFRISEWSLIVIGVRLEAEVRQWGPGHTPEVRSLGKSQKLVIVFKYYTTLMQSGRQQSSILSNKH